MKPVNGLSVRFEIYSETARQMTLESLIDTYGYWALLIGTFLEGETILVAGGFAANQGYLTLPGVILAAFAGSLCCDQLLFYLGRRHSAFILSKRPSWKSRLTKANKLLDRYQTSLILLFRFFYGFRTILPFVIGMSAVSMRKFLLLNAIGAMAWAVVIGSCGYIFGHALELLIGNIKRYEHLLILAVFLTGALIWVLYFMHRKKNKVRSEKDMKVRQESTDLKKNQ